MPSLPSRTKTFVLAAENYTKVNIKVFWSCPVLHDFATLLQIFFPGFYVTVHQLNLRKYLYFYSVVCPEKHHRLSSFDLSVSTTLLFQNSDKNVI